MHTRAGTVRTEYPGGRLHGWAPVEIFQAMVP
jgi:hypothetical protein